MPTIVISGYFGAGNAGDEAILAAMISVLREHVPGAEIVVLSRDPKATCEARGVAALQAAWLREPMAKIRLLRRADLLLSGGGGLFQDVYPVRLLPKSVFFYGAVVLIAKLLGCKVMIYAQGLGPLRGRLAKAATRLALRCADCISVRDPDSAALLGRLCAGGSTARLTADPTMAWEPAGIKGLEESFGLSGPRPWLAISVRPWRDGERVFRLMAETTDRAVEAWGAMPVFVPMARGVDAEAGRRVRDLMKWGEKAIVLPDLSPEEAFDIIGRADLLLGMRLHSLIFAALHRVPPVGLICDPKLGSFLERIGLAEYGCSWPVTGEHLWESLAKAYVSRGVIAAKLDGTLAEMRSSALENAEMAKELLELKK